MEDEIYYYFIYEEQIGTFKYNQVEVVKPYRYIQIWRPAKTKLLLGRGLLLGVF